MAAVLSVVRWTPVALVLSGTATAALGQPVCAAPEPIARTRELHYVVNARVRPLLFWIGRDNVGAGRITWSRAPQADRVELLVGSDPARTPLRVNRWGYLAETVCDAGADLVGVMTESEEATAGQASANVARAGTVRQAFRSIRSRIAAGRSDADVAHLVLDQALTYDQIDRLIPLVLQATGEKRATTIAGDTQPGFLRAVANLAERALSRSDRMADRLTIDYVYNGQLFELKLTSLQKAGSLANTEFRTRNSVTGNSTRFAVSFDTTADALTPERIRFRPRWWFEAELVLDRQATLSAASSLAAQVRR